MLCCVINVPFSDMPLFNTAQRAVSRSSHSKVCCQNLATLKKIVASSLLALNILPVEWGDLSKSGDGNTFVCPCSQTSRHVWVPLQLIMCRGQSAGVELICSCALLDVWIPPAASFLSRPMSSRFNFAFTTFQLPHISKILQGNSFTGTAFLK